MSRGARETVSRLAQLVLSMFVLAAAFLGNDWPPAVELLVGMVMAAIWQMILEHALSPWVKAGKP